MMRRPRIAVFGSVHMDLIAHADVLPDKARSGLAHGFSRGLGGKGGNQAAECAAAGAEAFMVTRLGDDAFGRQLFSDLKARGVNCTAVDVAASAQTGVSTVLSAPEGYTSLIYPGAAAEMADVPERVLTLAPLDMLLLQLELPVALSLAAAKAAKAMGARVALNASPPPAMNDDVRALLALSDLVVVNEAEAVALAGTADALTLAQSLRAIVVVTRGAKGSDASDGVSTWRAEAPRVAVKSTVGAGDAFLAGFCVALCKEYNLELALKAGTQSASKKLTSL